MASTTYDDPRKQLIDDRIRCIQDYPKPGVAFQDITTILLDPKAFQACIDIMAEHYADKKIDVICGFEARGLIFGAPLALALKIPFVPLRKPGKLPGPRLSVEYATEYSTDKIEMHEGAVLPGQRALLVDDLVATGGTLVAGKALVEKAGGVCAGAACIIELPELKGRAKLGDLDLFIVLERTGHYEEA